MSHLSLKNVSKEYNDGDHNTSVLKNINLEIDEGEFVSIVGFTGAGKTTLLKLIAGLVEPTEGMILYKNKPLVGMTLGEGFIFQNYSLLPWLSVLDNVLFGVNQKYSNLSKKVRKDIALHFVEKVKLTTAVNKLPHELSGGMRQRVAIARALSTGPDVLLMDEPLSALDALTRTRLQNEIASIWEGTRKTAILVTNSIEEAIVMASRVIVLGPAPAACFGRVFEVNIKKSTDHYDDVRTGADFISLKKEITGYMMDLRNNSKLQRNGC